MIHDIRGMEIQRGDYVAAPYQDRLYFGLVMGMFDTGMVKVRLYDVTFTHPVEQDYPFPNTQLLVEDAGKICGPTLDAFDLWRRESGTGYPSGYLERQDKTWLPR